MPIPHLPLRRPRLPFRTHREAPTVEPVTPESPSFAPAADRPASDRDVLFGYQIVLGRNPENSFVIAEGKASRLRDFLTGMLRSTEFQETVARPLASGGALPQERAGPGPTAAQMNWLRELLLLDAPRLAALNGAADWRELWRVLAELPEFPRGDITGAPAVAAPLEAAAVEHGFVLITLEQPRPGERLHPGASLIGSGWAIAPSDITEVALQLDGKPLALASHGLPRPDVARNFPHYRHVESCGFAFQVALPADLCVTDTSELAVTVRTVDGETGCQGVAVRPPENLPEKPVAPIRLAVEELAIESGGELRMRGWAAGLAPLATLEVLLGAQPLGRAEAGLARPDIAGLHPEYPNAAQAGWVFATRLEPPPAGMVSLRVLATDTAGRQRQVIAPATPGAAPPRRGRKPAAGNTAMRLELDLPMRDGEPLEKLRGTLTLSGWAVAPAGIEAVEVHCDGSSLGRAHLGIRRADVGRAFPAHQGSRLAGWALVVPAGQLPEGTRTLLVTARAHDGARLDREVTFRVAAADAALPGSGIRRTMPRAEAAFGIRLAARPATRHVTVLLQAAPPDAAPLAATLRALQAQVYPDWSVIVTGGAEPEGAACAAIAPRLRPLPPEPLPGTLVMRLRAGDEPGCDVLLELAIAHAQDPPADFVYADEVRIDPASDRRRDFLKPGWSPELLLGLNYVGRAWSARAECLARAGLSLPELAAAGDFDAVLRLSEAAGTISHVSKTLLLRGGAGDDEAAERHALQAALHRRRIAGEAMPLALRGTWRVRRGIPAPPRVSVVMPTCGARDLVRRAIASLRETAGQDIEIVLLDNVPRGNRKLKAWLARHADLVIEAPGPFNWSHFNNLGAEAAAGDVLVFVNDDIEARPGWLDAIMEQVLRPEVGVVGARLLYPDGTVQHAGQYLAETHARHAFRFAGAGDPGPFGLALVAREVTSVTGACFCVRRSVFEELGGFDEAHGVVNNDLDFCLRAREAGRAVIYTPHATLLHHELASRAEGEDDFDTERFFSRWRQQFLQGDPYRSPRLDRSDHWQPEPEPVLPVHAGPEGPALRSIARILAVKLDHIGDYLTAVPALRHLRRRFPQARIALLAPPATAALARSEPSVDEVIEFTFFHARSGRGRIGVSEGEFEALGARLAPYQFDMAIDLRVPPETRKTLRYSGAPFLVGYDHQGQCPYLTVALEWEGDTALQPKRQHLSERLVQLVAAAEAACEPPERVAPAPNPATLAALPPAFRAARLACVHPGAGNPIRQWPAAHFAELIDLLAARAGLHAVLVGGVEEQAVAEEILRGVAAKDRVVSLVGRLDLPQLREVMQGSALFVGNNSGPKHLAAALGVPTLGIHSAEVDATEWGPLGPAAFAIRRAMVCSPCYVEFASDCPRGMACKSGIRPRDAFAACLRLLGMREAAAIPNLARKDQRDGRRERNRRNLRERAV